MFLNDIIEDLRTRNYFYKSSIKEIKFVTYVSLIFFLEKNIWIFTINLVYSSHKCLKIALLIVFLIKIDCYSLLDAFIPKNRNNKY